MKRFLPVIHFECVAFLRAFHVALAAWITWRDFCFFPSVSATETFEFRCFSNMSRANALYFDVSQAMHRVLYRVVDVCQFCVESFGVSFAVAIWHALFVFLCSAKRIGLLFDLLLPMFGFYRF